MNQANKEEVTMFLSLSPTVQNLWLSYIEIDQKAMKRKENPKIIMV